MTLAGWFLIFLARFFSLAPDISGRARAARGEQTHTNPLLSRAGRRLAGAAYYLRSGTEPGRRGGWTSGAAAGGAASATGPSRTRGAASTRGRQTLSTAHAHGAMTPPLRTTFPRSPREPLVATCAAEPRSVPPLRGLHFPEAPAGLPRQRYIGQAGVAVGITLRRPQQQQLWPRW